MICVSLGFFLPSGWFRRRRRLQLLSGLGRFEFVKAWLNLISQFRWIRLSCLRKPLDCTLMQPQGCSQQRDGLVIISPKEWGRREQGMCFDNQRKQEGQFLMFSEHCCPIRVDLEVAVIPHERSHNPHGVGEVIKNG